MPNQEQNQQIAKDIADFEALSGQSADYLRDIYEASDEAYLNYTKFQTGIGQHNETAPKDAMAVASIAAMRQQDCGPCMQITVRFAEMNGVDRDIIEAAVRGESDRLPGLLQNVFLFADAVARRDASSTDYDDVLRAAYGDSGMVDLAFAIASAGVYPTLKRALGHGLACTSVKIGHTIIPMAPETVTHPDHAHAVA